MGQPMCPYCSSVDRQRAACLAFIKEPPARLLRTDEPAFVAYFGPHRRHAAALRASKPRMYLLELDYFAPGYQYARTTVAADVQNIPLQNRSLDGIIILHVLEHVPKLDRALQELHRVLRSDGFLHHETPCYRQWLIEQMPPADYTWVRGRRGEIEDCAAARTKNSTTGGLCMQRDHLWGFSCAHLKWRLRKNGFHCENTPSNNLSLADATRFVGPPMMHMALSVTKEGRWRCSKLGGARHLN